MHLREALLQANKIGYTYARLVSSVGDPKRILAIVETREVKGDRRKWAFKRVGPCQEPAVVLGNTSEYYAVYLPTPEVRVVFGKKPK